MPRGQYAQELDCPDEIQFWNTIFAQQGEIFTTAGRGSRPGKIFTYEIRGAEMFVSSRSKSITRATILYAYRKVKGMEKVPGPKAIRVYGDIYIFAVFKIIGMIT